MFFLIEIDFAGNCACDGLLIVCMCIDLCMFLLGRMISSEGAHVYVHDLCMYVWLCANLNSIN